VYLRLDVASGATAQQEDVGALIEWNDGLARESGDSSIDRPLSIASPYLPLYLTEAIGEQEAEPAPGGP
jgi:hypothetical protein